MSLKSVKSIWGIKEDLDVRDFVAGVSTTPQNRSSAHKTDTGDTLGRTEFSNERITECATSQSHI